MILKSLSFAAAASHVAFAASVTIDPNLAGCKALEKIGKTQVHYPIDEVVDIINVISEQNVPFALKSGGHAQNVGFSSTEGIQIALKNFNSVEYDPVTNLATIGTGQLWESVYAGLEPHGVSVNGGRVSGVGVGGFVLGGGYSWLTNQIGLTSDRVVEYEIVLYTGEILKVNREYHPDLFFGLKGGGNNFGIVTKVTLEAHQQGQVYGGQIFISKDSLSKANTAISNWDKNKNDPKSSIGVTYGYAPGQGLFAELLLFYDGPTPPKGVFDEILAIPSAKSSVFSRSYTDLVLSVNGSATDGVRGYYRGISLKEYPVVLLESIANYTETLGKEAESHSLASLVVAVEPFLKNINSHDTYGPSAFPHPADGYLSPANFIPTWTDEKEDSYFYDLTKKFSDAITFNADALGQNISHAIIYNNYANADVPHERIYGDNIDKIADIKKRYGVDRVSHLTGGFIVGKSVGKSGNW
ncbi:FAD dependent oxidoreductase [Wallemia mellicola CBS 633.66]|uniref:FAD dependent oxidoreductase n=1 Tax=Wallemia mellicola (strain ATCC MYA-4683 / CBS 633.66) TaxID=671144 RepID=I4Y7X3_WALMC|nr:FAD dependent oxidoreductase [Wallemia mellicola CBS 633.66]EIM20065.1 FAD dependent oxidoreductase [Wallemia mellicola CBS 633.66]|eukprot:XP_006959786.1 FAD dependent oxidoreductase [Wallemia mellicola CBS 633.66]